MIMKLTVTDDCRADKFVTVRRQPYRLVSNAEMWVILSPTIGQRSRNLAFAARAPQKNRPYKQPKPF